MNIIVVGSGGREHAIIKKIKENPNVTRIFALPGNGGMEGDAECVPIKATDIDSIKEFALTHGVDYVIVSPDNPLVLGAVDELRDAGIPCFGPDSKAAYIEGSKVYAKRLMRKYGIPTAAFEIFDDADKALAYLDALPSPIVVKADGLALGKGVIVAQTYEQARDAINAIMRYKIFGSSGRRIVLEEYMTGPEVSVLCFTDGETIVPMVSSMDHKRIYDDDEGPNTGGMGAVAPNPYYTPEIAQECMDRIFLPTIRALKAEGRTFKGCLYFGLMLTKDGPKVIEYNCRFGDPEAQVVLPLLQSDLLTVMQAVSNGTLAQTEVKFSSDSACCVVVASKGYPIKFEKNVPIYLPEPKPGTQIYVAGAKMDNGQLVSDGGRVIGVTATAPTLQQAVDKAYELTREVGFASAYYRKDIGKRALQAYGGER